ncbi:hypothetical protein ACFL2T_02785 [Elusimicrobiota bacterium]
MIRRNVLLVLLFGSLWGLLEVSLGEALYSANIPYSSVFLSILALGILGIAYTLIPMTGVPTLIAATAALFRIVNAGPSLCHLLGIFLLGVGFDIATRLIRERKLSWLSGAIGAWLGYALFAFLITYVFRYHHWTAVGFPKVIRHIGIDGSLAALGSAASVWLGYKIGDHIIEFMETKPRLVYAGATGFTLCFWLLGAI